MFTFWGWQLVIVLCRGDAAAGHHQGKEYAELEWPIDVLITLVWVVYAVVFFGTIGMRKVRTSTSPTGSSARSSSDGGAAARRQQRRCR